MDFTLYFKILLSIAAALGSAGLLIGGTGYVISIFKKGSKQKDSDVLSSADQLSSFWKEQVEGFKTIIAELTSKLEKQKDDHNIEMKKLIDELGQVKGQLNAETKAKSEYLDILQNRDPETKKFMEYMIKAVENQSSINAEIVRVLGEIHSMTKAENERDLKIDATIHKA